MPATTMHFLAIWVMKDFGAYGKKGFVLWG